MTKITRRVALLTSVAMTAAFATLALGRGLPPLKQKADYKVGFAQTESNKSVAPSRRPASMKAEAAKLGWAVGLYRRAGPPPSRSRTSTA